MMLRTLGAGAALVLAAQVVAQQVDGALGAEPREAATGISLRAGGVYTDNLGRDAAEKDDLAGLVGVTLDIVRSLTRVDFTASGALDYLMYGSSEFDNEAVGNVNANVTAKLVPGVFNWSIDNSFGQFRSDYSRATGPGNREYFNRLSTGPDVFVPLNERTRMSLQARYADRRFDDSVRLDSEELSATVRLLREINPQQQVGLSGSTRRIEYDGSDVEYDVNSLYLSYVRALANGRMSVDIGGNQLDLEGDKQSGLLLRLNWNRNVGTRSNVSVNVGREFADAGAVYLGRNLSQTPDTETGELVLTPDPMTRDTAGIGYVRTGSRLTLRAGATWGKQEYETSNGLDREIWSYNAGLGWQLSPLASVDVGLRLRHENFDSVDAENDELRASIGVTRELTQRFGVTAQYDYIDRDGEATADFQENRISLFLTFTPRAL